MVCCMIKGPRNKCSHKQRPDSFIFGALYMLLYKYTYTATDKMVNWFLNQNIDLVYFLCNLGNARKNTFYFIRGVP